LRCLRSRAILAATPRRGVDWLLGCRGSQLEFSGSLNYRGSFRAHGLSIGRVAAIGSHAGIAESHSCTVASPRRCECNSYHHARQRRSAYVNSLAHLPRWAGHCPYRQGRDVHSQRACRATYPRRGTRRQDQGTSGHKYRSGIQRGAPLLLQGYVYGQRVSYPTNDAVRRYQVACSLTIPADALRAPLKSSVGHLRLTPLTENIVVGLVSGIIAGLVTGLYSGLVVSRFVRFSSLCSEAHRAVNSIEYMQEQRRVVVDRNESLVVPLVGADLMYFGHKSAGLCVLAQHKVVAGAIYSAEQGQIGIDELAKVLNQARSSIRKAWPSSKILLPWGRV